MNSISLRNRYGKEFSLSESHLQDYRNSLQGSLILPGDDEYDAGRAVYNAMHSGRPEFIVQAADVADVMSSVRFAREHELLLAVRGGGHSVPGYGTCDGGMVLDLVNMKSVHIDPHNQTLRAEGGCTLGDVDHAGHAFGLAVPSGTVSTTGVGGLTLGGGMGHLSRHFGLTIDNLKSADLVLANGQFIKCDQNRHADLFWALRGGGGNFGVVTSFEFQAHPVTTILGGPTFFHRDAQVVQNYHELITTAPEALNALLAFAWAPATPFVPEEWHDKPVIGVLACWSGPEEEDEAIIEQLTGLGDVIGQAVWRMPYPEVNTFFDELLPAGLQNYWKANISEDFTEETIAAHLEYGAKVPSAESGAFLFPINGACHRIAEDATAFPNRDATLSAVIAGSWKDSADNEANIQWVRDYHDALKPWSREGGYVNFMSDDDQAEISLNYGPGYQKLRRIKATYDPDNFFSLNQNIQPATEGK